MKRAFSHLHLKPEKTCAVLRYGGFGDALQAISVLPELKRQGYHITFYCVPAAWEVIKHDPHIDAVVLHDEDQIPNAMLGAFWAYTASKYDRFINLSESVERSLLALPGSIPHGWPWAMRHKHMNANYIEFVHDIADVPLPARVKFYATPEEHQWALDQKQIMSGRKLVMWVLSGSSVHKVWPYMDQVIDALLREDPSLRFVLVGDELARTLQAGWQGVPHVHLRAGQYSIRQTMALAQVCDMVIGPETGVMNAVSYEPMPKVITLSHSSVQNLSRDWRNCISLTPPSTSCYPCHQIHFTFEHCREVEGLAACQRDIHPQAMIDAVKAHELVA